jgi:DNA-binding CsgD family transcriptional regulator
LFTIVTLAHAQLRSGLPVQVPEHETVDLPVLAGVPAELAGLSASSVGDRAGARESFVEAAGLWRGRHRRGEQRCRWLAAEAAEDVATVKAELETLEGELAADGWAPLLAAVRGSLRTRGIRRSAPRGRAGGVTLREREVLDLVAQGLSTDAVAARLGISPATVAALVASARTRLGAATRWQAVSER